MLLRKTRHQEGGRGRRGGSTIDLSNEDDILFGRNNRRKRRNNNVLRHPRQLPHHHTPLSSESGDCKKIALLLISIVVLYLVYSSVEMLFRDVRGEERVGAAAKHDEYRQYLSHFDRGEHEPMKIYDGVKYDLIEVDAAETVLSPTQQDEHELSKEEQYRTQNDEMEQNKIIEEAKRMYQEGLSEIEKEQENIEIHKLAEEVRKEEQKLMTESELLKNQHSEEKQLTEKLTEEHAEGEIVEQPQPVRENVNEQEAVQQKILNSDQTNDNEGNQITQGDLSQIEVKQEVTQQQIDENNVHLSENTIEQNTQEIVPPVRDVASAPIIAYLVPLLDCPISPSNSDDKDDSPFYDILAVLKHSVHRSSIHNPSSSSQYSYQMVALIHQSVSSCLDNDRMGILQSLGYKVVVRGNPVERESIQGEYLRNTIEHSGKHGVKDWMKIYAFEMVEFPLVVLLDIKTILLKPLDELFNIMIFPEKHDMPAVWKGSTGIKVARNHPSHHELRQINIMYTNDYISVAPNKFKSGMNTGLLVLRPNLDYLAESVKTMQKGNFDYHSGWGEVGFGNFNGDMLTKGFLSYFFLHMHRGEGLELDRCLFHNMADIPYIRIEGKKICRDKEGEEEGCEDCRETELDSVRTMSFGVCREPWTCFKHSEVSQKLNICRKFHRTWFSFRREIEEGMKVGGYVPSDRNGDFKPQISLGYCVSEGKAGYIKMVKPK